MAEQVPSDHPEILKAEVFRRAMEFAKARRGEALAVVGAADGLVSKFEKLYRKAGASAPTPHPDSPVLEEKDFEAAVLCHDGGALADLCKNIMTELREVIGAFGDPPMPRKPKPPETPLLGHGPGADPVDGPK